MELYHLNMKQAKDLIAKTDKTRESYYHFYTNHKWDDLLNYDLSVDSSILGYDDTAELLVTFIRKKAEIEIEKRVGPGLVSNCKPCFSVWRRSR